MKKAALRRPRKIDLLCKSVRDIEGRARLANAFVNLVPFLLRVTAGVFLQRLLARELHHDGMRAIALRFHGLRPYARDAGERSRQFVRPIEGRLDLLWRRTFLESNRDDVDQGLGRSRAALGRCG